MGIVGSRPFLIPSYSPTVDESLVNKLKAKGNTRGNLFSYLNDLWLRFKNYVVGINSQEFTIPLRVLIMAGKAEEGQLSTCQTACVEAMHRFNGLPRQEVNGYAGPRVIMTSPPDNWHNAGNYVFYLVYQDLKGNKKQIELCRVDREKDIDFEKKRRKKFNNATQFSRCATCESHELISQFPESFKHESELYDLFLQMKVAKTVTDCDAVFLTLRKECLDPRIKFKARIRTVGEGEHRFRLKSYWVVLPNQSVYALKKNIPSDNWLEDVPSNTRDHQDDVWLKLPEDVEVVDEQPVLYGSGFFFGGKYTYV
ncbi:hypothetical protein [Parashewanella tropica]|uniref:hypothetical protein n=1 Tax=Parashewanella tropica TaxID=2547970 RepID=UPI00105A9F83|nr:hypothetical protein [Parashewanella tropica]